MKRIDLRSDTVTKPSRGMLEAMVNSVVGDDVFEEDETVNALQEKCAEMTGKEAALFVATGVLANQLAVKCHTIPGDEVIVESESHILNYETGSPAVISNVQLLAVNGKSGVLYAADLGKYVRTPEYYFPVTRLICLENTHNRAGGVIQPIEAVKDISKFARENKIRMHLDGARIFNACAETGISVKEYSLYFDSVSFCFSKGLGCPVGSVLCGGRDFIEMARKWRKILGGGMRQAGILAGAAVYALDNNVERLKEDNDKAKLFARELSGMNGIKVDLETVQTNIVIFSSDKIPKKEFMNELKERGVLISSGSYESMRAVFHMDVSLREVENALVIIRETL